MILGFDPGRDKCGVAVLNSDRQVQMHQVVASDDAITTIKSLIDQYSISLIVIGDQTTSKIWHQKLTEALPKVTVEFVDERNSTLEARDRYWEMYPPQGLQKLIPQSLRIPPRPIDDIVAILLIERYLLNWHFLEG